MDEVDSRAEVAQRLAAIPITVRFTVAYVYLDGNSVSEVAEMQGVTPGRIRQKLRQARLALGISDHAGWGEWVEDFGDLLKESF